MGAVNRKDGACKIASQLTASHGNWLQESANKMEGGTIAVLYSTNETLQVPKSRHGYQISVGGAYHKRYK